MGCFMRSVHGTFPQYHTSADNPGFVKPQALNQSYEVVASCLTCSMPIGCTHERTAEANPNLGGVGLYRAIAGQKEAGGASQMDLLWLLNLADGKHNLLEMAESALAYPLAGFRKPFASR